LNGVPYLQTIKDITIHGESVGIHVEPGIWVHVPATDIPQLGELVTRMGSIPHGATIEAQGTFAKIAGKPNIAPVDITPFVTGNPANKIVFASQTASDPNTPRIPQDLGPFIARGTITQDLLNDPNSLLRNHIANQTITETTTIVISTAPQQQAVPFGGGVDNIAFLLGQAAAVAPNAQAIQLFAIFWIEAVQELIPFPYAYRVGAAPLKLKARPNVPGQRVPTFSISPKIDLDEDPHRNVTVNFTQIQYTQTVLLNFAGLTWPHVSVNTLVPADDIVISDPTFSTNSGSS